MRVQESIRLISRKSKIIQLFSTNKIKEQLWKEQSLNFWLVKILCLETARNV